MQFFFLILISKNKKSPAKERDFKIYLIFEKSNVSRNAVVNLPDLN